LRFYRQNLSIRFVSRFSAVNKVFDHSFRFPKIFAFSFTSYLSAAALNFPCCEASMRSPRPPPRRAHLCRFTICGLFTKISELFFKGSAASAPTHSPRHLYRSAFGLVKSRFEHTEKLRSFFQCKENAKI